MIIQPWYIHRYVRGIQYSHETNRLPFFRMPTSSLFDILCRPQYYTPYAQDIIEMLSSDLNVLVQQQMIHKALVFITFLSIYYTDFIAEYDCVVYWVLVFTPIPSKNNFVNFNHFAQNCPKMQLKIIQVILYLYEMNPSLIPTVQND